MKVLYHHRTLGDGAEGVHIQSMVEALRALGHDVRVASLVGQQTNVTTSRTKLLGALTRRLPRMAYECLELGYSAVGYRWLLGQIRKWQPDFVYERYTLFNLAGLAAARHAGIPFVLEVNAPLAYERARYEHLSLKRIGQRYETYICRKADLVVVVSTPLKEHLVRNGADPDRIVVVPNGADPDVFRPNPEVRARVRRELGVEPHEVVIGFSGILRPWHGMDLLLEAAGGLEARGIRPRLLIVGDGPSRAEFERMAREKGLVKPIFVGRVPHAKTSEYLAAFDVGVSPRATYYASPMKIPEYMAIGMAVVAPRMPNIEDLVTDRVDGLLFTPEDPQSLAAVLGEVCRDTAVRERLASSARQSIVSGRTWVHTAAHILRCLGAAAPGAFARVPHQAPVR